jgi:hypothetical protein
MQLHARGAVVNGQLPQIEPEREFIICSLDLISGLAEGLGRSIESFVGPSNLRQMLVQCCQVRSRPPSLRMTHCSKPADQIAPVASASPSYCEARLAVQPCLIRLQVCITSYPSTQHTLALSSPLLSCLGRHQRVSFTVRQDVSADVRQSAFALVGDLAKVAAAHLAPVISDLLALGVANLQPAMLRMESMSACNNACWSLGACPTATHACRHTAASSCLA